MSAASEASHRRKAIEEAALTHYCHKDDLFDEPSVRIKKAFIAGAEWADKNPADSLQPKVDANSEIPPLLSALEESIHLHSLAEWAWDKEHYDSLDNLRKVLAKAKAALAETPSPTTVGSTPDE